MWCEPELCELVAYLQWSGEIAGSLRRICLPDSSRSPSAQSLWCAKNQGGKRSGYEEELLRFVVQVCLTSEVRCEESPARTTIKTAISRGRQLAKVEATGSC